MSHAGTRLAAETAWHRQRADVERWRAGVRPQALRLIAEKTSGLSWTKDLFALLLDELHVDDLFSELVGPPDRLPVNRYPKAVAVAIALRHSWQPDDLGQIAQQLGVILPSAAAEHLVPARRSADNGGPRSRQRARGPGKATPIAPLGRRLAARSTRPARPHL